MKNRAVCALAIIAGACFIFSGLWRTQVLDESNASDSADAGISARELHNGSEFPALADRRSGREIPPVELKWEQQLASLKTLAAADPELAFKQIAEMSEAEERQAALKEVCIDVSTRDPQLALTAAWRMELGGIGGKEELLALETLASRWAANDRSAALAWTDRQTRDESGRFDHIVRGIATAWSQSSPTDSARLIAEQMSPNFLQFDAAMNLVGRWAIADYPAAASWVDIFSEGPVRERGRAELAKAVELK